VFIVRKLSWSENHDFLVDSFSLAAAELRATSRHFASSHVAPFVRSYKANFASFPAKSFQDKAFLSLRLKTRLASQQKRGPRISGINNSYFQNRSIPPMKNQSGTNASFKNRSSESGHLKKRSTAILIHCSWSFFETYSFSWLIFGFISFSLEGSRSCHIAHHWSSGTIYVNGKAEGFKTNDWPRADQLAWCCCLPDGFAEFKECYGVFRGLQALSVQFRFAFSKPYSSQTRFLNRPVAAPAEVAHFCHYKKKYFSTNLRFEGWILETILLSTISTLQNANWSKNKNFL